MASFVFKPSIENDDSGSSSASDSVSSPGHEPNLRNESLRHNSLNGLVRGPGEISVTSEPSRGNTRGCNNIASAAKCLKPSGLRLPTPKLGYFDAEKSLTHDVESFLHATQRSFTSNNSSISRTVMEIPPSNNFGTLSQINRKHNLPQFTVAASNKSNPVNKLKAQTVNNSSSSMTPNIDCPPVQSLHSGATDNPDINVAEQLPESSDSCNIPTMVKAFHESQSSVQKAPPPVKLEGHSKIPEAATEENSKFASEKLPTAQCLSVGHLNSLTNNPSEENSAVFREEHLELNQKCSLKDSRAVALENQVANWKQCHMETTVMDKENILPVDSQHKNMDAIIELLEDKVSSLSILD